MLVIPSCYVYLCVVYLPLGTLDLTRNRYYRKSYFCFDRLCALYPDETSPSFSYGVYS